MTTAKTTVSKKNMVTGRQRNLIRKEIWLSPDDITKLERNARAAGMQLKPYMEHLLTKKL